MSSSLNSQSLVPARRRVLADETADVIRDAIFSGQIEPGRRLIEEELASQLGVSRGPVREALARLEQEGLVQTARHRGSAVAVLSMDEVHEIYSLRTSLERLAVEWACKAATEADFERLSDVLDEFDRLGRPASRASVATLDVKFHDAVFLAAHHERLYRTWLTLRSQMFVYLVNRGALRPNYQESWRGDHEMFLDALRSRKVTTARRLAEHHITGSYKRAVAANGQAPPEIEGSEPPHA